MSEPDRDQQGLNEEQLMGLVKLFEGFNEASSQFAASYNQLERRIGDLSAQLVEQGRMLERTEEFLSSVLAHVPVGIIVLDMDGRISLFNEEAIQLTGLPADEVVGKPYGDVLACSVDQPNSAVFTLTNGTVIDQREKELKVNGGGALPVRFSTSWIYNEKGQPVGVLEVFEDMRTVRALQQRMQHSANLAALGEMAAQVAHELRNPLAGVQGFAQFLLEDVEEDHPARPIVNKIISGVRDIEQIASRLLEFTRPIQPNMAEVDLAQLLAEEVELTRAELSREEREITVGLELPEEEVAVACDGSLIKQVVLNLLKNSIQAIAQQGRVNVRLRWDLLRNRVHLLVKDDGRGIEDEDLDRIFNPFFTTRTKGTGLGLSMVKKIVDAHGGSIEVESTVGEGSLFVVDLPITRDT